MTISDLIAHCTHSNDYKVLYNDDKGNFAIIPLQFNTDKIFKSLTSWFTADDRYIFDIQEELYVICVNFQLYHASIVDNWFTILDKNNLMLNQYAILHLYNTSPDVFASINAYRTQALNADKLHLYDVNYFELLEFVSNLSGTNSNVYNKFIEFLCGEGFESVNSYVYINGATSVTVYDIMVLSSKILSIEILCTICYQVLLNYKGCGDKNFINLYYLLSCENWADIVCNIAKNTGKLPPYYYNESEYEYFWSDAGEYYIPLYHAIKHNRLNGIELTDIIVKCMDRDTNDICYEKAIKTLEAKRLVRAVNTRHL